MTGVLGDVAAVLTVAAALGAALVAGVFFAFSAFVMRGLGRSGPVHAVPAMQGINLAAVRPPLMLLLFGTLVLQFAAALALFATLGWSLATWLAIGSFAAYGAGVVVVTATGNVPLNNRLAASVDPSDAESSWQAFAEPWTRLNQIRTLTATACSVLSLAALLLV